MLQKITKPSEYSKELNSIENTFNVSINKYESLYPEHKFDIKNSEYKNLFLTTEEQLGEIFKKATSLENKLISDALNLSSVIEKDGDKLEKFKKQFRNEKQYQNRLQSENLAGKPREQEFKYLLDNEYLQFGYYLSGIGVSLFLTYLLFKSKI